MQKLAFVFPGQGSQALGMLGEFSDQAIVRNTFSEASDALGYDLWALISEGPVEKLNQTNYTQPALLSASVAVWRLWREKSQAQPTVLAGHSLGEYSALSSAEYVCIAVRGCSVPPRIFFIPNPAISANSFDGHWH